MGARTELILGIFFFAVIAVVVSVHVFRLRKLLKSNGVPAHWLSMGTVELISANADILPTLEVGLQRGHVALDQKEATNEPQWCQKQPGRYRTLPNAVCIMSATLKSREGKTLLTVRRTPLLWSLPLCIPGVIVNPGLFLLPMLAIVSLFFLFDLSGMVAFTLATLRESGLAADSQPNLATTAK